MTKYGQNGLFSTGQTIARLRSWWIVLGGGRRSEEGRGVVQAGVLRSYFQVQPERNKLFWWLNSIEFPPVHIGA